ncbi:MAG: ribonuclease H-like domain-containing protein [Planctomycetota bacterium]|nr:ribonuclease H-like domain-containing protein [Planctomycetota bacterium]
MKRLRREETGAEPAGARVIGPGSIEPARVEPSSTNTQSSARKSALGRLRERLQGRGQAYGESSSGPGTQPACPTQLGPPKDLVSWETTHGTCQGREALLSGTDMHGDWHLEEAHLADPKALAIMAQDPRLLAASSGDALFLDTETTGLAGGTGTWVFMVGLGRFRPDGTFELWQGFLPGPEAEKPFLHEVARRIGAAGTLVSFFGKSYDQHRLLDRFRLHGLPSPFENRRHLDLYHPLKRLCGGQGPGPYGDHKLQTLERRLCGHQRVDDLPGSAAPEAWFDFLRGDPHRLEGVFHHNFLDVLSLVTLYGYLGRALTGRRGDGQLLLGSELLRNLALVKSACKARDFSGALQLLGTTDFPEGPLEQVLLLDRLRGECLLRTGATAEGEELLGLVHLRAQGAVEPCEGVKRAALESAQMLARSAAKRQDLVRAAEAHQWAGTWLACWPGLASHAHAQERMGVRLDRSLLQRSATDA